MWKYKIELKNVSVFENIEKDRNIKFPEELKKFIIEYNGATPEKYNFMLGNSEKVFGAVLSFNKGESDTDTIFTALECIDDKDILPFAIDPFGNYICYSIPEKKVVFYEHETNNIISTKYDLSSFIKALY